MSSAAPGFERFRRVVLEDRDLQARLRQVPEWDELLARLIEMGEGGAEEVRRALRESRSAWLQRWVS